MAYFPTQLMPLTPKIDASLASVDSISATDYNTHDQELYNIEAFLGFPQLLAAGRRRTSAGSPVSIFDRVRVLTEKINNMSLNGFVSASGFALSGSNENSTYGTLQGMDVQKMVVGMVPVSFLTSNVIPLDNTIRVVSTSDFPGKGIITLISPISSDKFGLTMEYVSYDGKTDVSFLNCKRGINGTVATNIIVNEGGQSNANTADDCFGTPPACKNRWPAFNRDVLTLSGLGATGTEDELVIDLMLHPYKYPLEPMSQSMDIIRTIASDIGILAIVDGHNVLQSADAYTRSRGVLTGNEASAFLDGLIGENLYSTIKNSNITVGTNPYPVFLGQISIQYAPVYWRKSGVDSGFQILQDGFRCGLSGNLDGKASDIVVGGVGYQLLCVPFAVDDEEA